MSLPEKFCFRCTKRLSNEHSSTTELFVRLLQKLCWASFLFLDELEWLQQLDDNQPNPSYGLAREAASSSCAHLRPHRRMEFQGCPCLRTQKQRVNPTQLSLRITSAGPLTLSGTKRLSTQIVGCAVITRPVVPHPLHVLPEDQRGGQSRLAPLERRLGRLGLADDQYHLFADPWHAAEHGR